MKRLSLPVLVLLLGFSVPGWSACNPEWRDIFNSESLSRDEKLERWLALGPGCDGDASYAHRLAFVYSQAGRFDDAERVLNAAIAKFDDPADLAVLEYDLIDLQRERQLHAGTTSEAATRELLGKFLAHAEKYSGHALGYSAAAGLYLSLNDVEKAAEFSRRAIEIEPDYLAYRTQAIALTNLEQFERAVGSAISASELNPGFVRDINLMLSVAYAYVAMGDVDNAKAALSAILQARPEVKEQDSFNRLVLYVYQRAEEIENATE